MDSSKPYCLVPSGGNTDFSTVSSSSTKDNLFPLFGVNFFKKRRKKPNTQSSISVLCMNILDTDIDIYRYI